METTPKIVENLSNFHISLYSHTAILISYDKKQEGKRFL